MSLRDPPAKPTEYEDAVRSVQEWNEALKAMDLDSRYTRTPLSSSMEDVTDSTRTIVPAIDFDQSAEYTTYGARQTESQDSGYGVNPLDLSDHDELADSRLEIHDWDWCRRGTSHVDFGLEEKVPLEEGRLLGHGVHGGVYETRAQGRTIAWKRKFTRRRIGAKEKKEIEILKKLRHHHIIQLVGTYTKGPMVGLLLYPVAVCDLASLLEDVDLLYHGPENKDQYDPNLYDQARTRISILLNEETPNQDSISARLYSTIGCTASAIAYLHQNKIKHKDLKPANILLGEQNRLWLTDFGTSTEFSYGESATEGGERGTPKYFAPEVAAYEAAGRSAEIFSFGCIILEIVAICNGYSLKQLEALRPDRDRSFHANVMNLKKWFDGISLDSLRDTFLMTDVRMMLRTQPQSRPKIQRLIANLRLLDYIVGPTKLHYNCCKTQLPVPSPKPANLPFQDLSFTYGNTYESIPGPEHRFNWSFFVWPSDPDVVDKMVFFLHPSCRDPQRVMSNHPFEIYSSNWGTFEIGCFIFLKSQYQWYYNSFARGTPLFIHWRIQIDDPIRHTKMNAPIYLIGGFEESSASDDTAGTESRTPRPLKTRRSRFHSSRIPPGLSMISLQDSLQSNSRPQRAGPQRNGRHGP